MALRSTNAGHGGDVRTLLGAAPALTSAAGRLGDLDAHVHLQSGVRFDVLPSETDPTGTGIVDGHDFAAPQALLTRSTGSCSSTPATSVAWMLDTLAEGLHAHLLPTAVTLLHDPAPRTSDKFRPPLGQPLRC